MLLTSGCTRNSICKDLSSSGLVSSTAIFCSHRGREACIHEVSSHFAVLSQELIPSIFSRSVNYDSDELASVIGIMQALISVFLDDRDKLRCINSGKTRINFLVRSPLYYAAVSSWGEPESVVSTFIHVKVVLYPCIITRHKTLIVKKEDAVTS